jgi:uncharacterized protein YoxC
MGQLVGGMVEANERTVSRLTGTVQEVTRVSGDLLAKINEQALSMFTGLNAKIEDTNLQISEYLARAVREYAQVSTRIEQAVTSSHAQTAEKLAAVVADVSLEGGRIIENAGSRVSGLYNDLLARIDKSIDGMGENLAASMRAAMGESVEIGEKLAVRTTEMKDLYDDYFARISEQSAKTLDDLDFSIQKVLAAFSAKRRRSLKRLRIIPPGPGIFR